MKQFFPSLFFFLGTPVTTTFSFTSLSNRCPEYQTGYFRLEKADLPLYGIYCQIFPFFCLLGNPDSGDPSWGSMPGERSGFFSRKRPYLFGLRCPGTATRHFQHCSDLPTCTTKSDLPSPVFMIQTHQDAFGEAYSFSRHQMDWVPIQSS